MFRGRSKIWGTGAWGSWMKCDEMMRQWDTCRSKSWPGGLGRRRRRLDRRKLGPASARDPPTFPGSWFLRFRSGRFRTRVGFAAKVYSVSEPAAFFSFLCRGLLRKRSNLDLQILNVLLQKALVESLEAAKQLALITSPKLPIEWEHSIPYTCLLELQKIPTPKPSTILSTEPMTLCPKFNTR